MLEVVLGANLGDGVSIVGIGALPVLKEHPLSLRQLGAATVRSALADAGIDHADALFVGNMLADMGTKLSAARALLLSAAEKFDSGARCAASGPNA